MLSDSLGATLIQDDASYFRNRAVQEQVAAQRATSDAARRCHDELAAAYRFRAATLPKPVTCREPFLGKIGMSKVGDALAQPAE